MLAQLIAVGLMSAASSPPAGSDEVAVSAERTAIVAVIQSLASTVAGLPLGAPEWAQPYDPADHAPYAIDFGPLLDEGEKIASIANLRLSSAAAALGITIDAASTFAPIIDSVTGRLVQLWFVVSSPNLENASFTAAGVKIAVTAKIVTDSAPQKTFERSAVLTVRQL